MEYVQMNLDDWVQMKQKLKQELLGVKQSFVRIGYALRQIDDQKLYEQDGYKSIAEFAQAEYGLGPSITSRFMSINREYSIDGYSEQLRPEYAELGRSQLEEMLKLPDADRQMIQPETSREDIRELKRFNKAEPAAGVADDISQLVEKFYQDNELILNAVYGEEFEEQTMKKAQYRIRPMSQEEKKMQQKLLSQRMTVEQLEKLALMMSRRLRKEAWKIMEQLMKQEQDKRKMTPMEKKAAKQIVKNLQRGPMNRQERRARERKLRPRKNPRKH